MRRLWQSEFRMTSVAFEKTLLNASELASALARMADAMASELKNDDAVFLAGIPTRGVPLAKRLARELAVRGVECDCGSVDISMYRDDLGMREGISPLQNTELPVDLDRRTLVLVDDVQHTGRTARAAIEAVLAFGRPRRICLAVLVDRGGRELPIRPDFTGTQLSVAPNVRVRVRLAESDNGEEGAFAS